MDVNLDPRQQRGLQIAATAKITKKGGAWLVPSQSGKGRYTVCPDPQSPHCNCPDHETRGGKCKHIIAVEYVLLRERNADGSTTVTETLTVQQSVRKTYPQDWRAYNRAQTQEKDQFLELLHELCAGVAEPPRPKNGRPRLPIQDAIFAACFKVYSTVSARRFMSDLRAAQAKGYIAKTPHFNSVLNYLESPEVTLILKGLITESSLPLKSVEVDFACDSSGFTTSRFHRWFDHKYGARQQHEWVKVHLMTGVRTNIVTAVEIRDKDASDTKLLPDLVNTTAKSFVLNEVSADKGYGSLSNYDAIRAHGAVPYIAFKSIHTGKGGGLWRKMFHYFQFNRDEYLRHYHKRSNVESTFSMIKAKFRDHVRSKTDVAMKNEVLCKIICHNICCLIQETHELGVSAVFWKPSPA
ncbi:MAG: transposase [Xanthobacteraceae bacterium]